MHYDALNYANLIYKNTNVFNKKKNTFYSKLRPHQVSHVSTVARLI